MYNIAISDLDGTLLGPDHMISDKTKESIINWVDADKKFVIATGRHYLDVKKYQEFIGIPLYLITSNGGRVHDKDGNIIFAQNLQSDIAQYITEMDFDKSVQVNVFTDDKWYANFSLPELDEFNSVSGFSSSIADLVLLNKENVIKIFFWAENEELQIIHNKLKNKFGDKLNLTFSLSKCLEVMHGETNKGAAVKVVLKEKNIALDKTIAFGDAMNDIEMLSIVGNGVLMGNAQEQLQKELSGSEFTLSSGEHGVAVKMEQLLKKVAVI